MDARMRCHRITVGLLLFCLAIEALTLYPVFTVFVLAVPLGLFGLNRCMSALVQ
jgi:hypothetical protein